MDGSRELRGEELRVEWRRGKKKWWTSGHQQRSRQEEEEGQVTRDGCWYRG